MALPGSLIQLLPTHEEREGVDVLWQIPDEPRAVLFIAHAGNGNPGTYWDHHPHYLHSYIGLQEHKLIVRYALSRSYAVIAVKSVKDYWQDWPPEASQDAINVKLILNAWLSEHGLQDLPLTGLGAASGGNFLSVLALTVKFSAIVVMISHGVTRSFEKSDGTYPPTLFIHMPKDTFTSRKVAGEIETLRSKGIPAKSIACSEFPVYPQAFVDHAPGLSFESAAKIYLKMITEGVISSQGLVIDSLRPSKVGNLLQSLDILPATANDELNVMRMKEWEENISHLLRVAEARHAVTGRHCEEMFDWLDGKM
ncbi:hypothetical protein O6H91_07G090700 [Diphasiastrum complanatum]|uniref:Uncharacterized protein n=3 Tax=Diphasiastrum complanatum TaxID=34168 RepID=A0ACC2D7Z8_DIPCM|nr:hypothetical protein O6H91_07G054100 [Diphasiastrum complanatum]KAJ7549464.1 hypothetical protein O6H91_07G054200 [Diphasiastrum complanatum]KAJ7550252.1 hypothetical protein O6H91_07G090700 [Diphasiastrum complanatum]